LRRGIAKKVVLTPLTATLAECLDILRQR